MSPPRQVDGTSKNAETRPLAVVLVSGGLDSCTAAAIAACDYRLAMLHASYGQRTQTRELSAFHALATHFQVEHRLAVQVPHLQQIGGSSLTNPALAVPITEHHTSGVPSTYVPFRNANLLAMAVSWAEVLEAPAVFIGTHEASSPYPDCRSEFIAAFNRVVALGTRKTCRTQVYAPLAGLDKKGIITRAVELNAPLHLTWSCYQHEDVACGRCHSCRLRLAGFRAAGVRDPLPYAVRDGQNA